MYPWSCSFGGYLAEELISYHLLFCWRCTHRRQNTVKLQISCFVDKFIILCVVVVTQKLSVWTVEDNYLRASFEIVCSTNRQMVCFCVTY